MDKMGESIEAGDKEFEGEEIEVTASAPRLPRTRLDPRTGKQMMLQPASFWRDHDERRKASGQSVRQYCEEHGLALSTFRRWSGRVAGRKRVEKPRQGEGKQAVQSTQTGFLSVPIRAASGCEAASGGSTTQIEVHTPSGMKVRLYGRAVDRAIDAVMAELSGCR